MTKCLKIVSKLRVKTYLRKDRPSSIWLTIRGTYPRTSLKGTKLDSKKTYSKIASRLRALTCRSKSKDCHLENQRNNQKVPIRTLWSHYKASKIKRTTPKMLGNLLHAGILRRLSSKTSTPTFSKIINSPMTSCNLRRVQTKSMIRVLSKRSWNHRQGMILLRKKNMWPLRLKGSIASPNLLSRQVSAISLAILPKRIKTLTCSCPIWWDS